MPSSINYQLNAKTQQFLAQSQKLFINNEWISPNAKETLPVINPANGTQLTEIAIADKTAVDIAVSSARKAFQETWSSIAPSERAKLIWKLADLMERDKLVLEELETVDNGKPLDKAVYDIEGAIEHFRYYAGWATKIEGSSIPVGSDKLVYTRKEPLGVVGLIVPWNFPLMIAAWKLAPALACGNCCILKPAEQTSLTALYLGNLIQEAGFPAGVVNIVTGPGFPTGDAISRHPDIDKVSFTGSTAVGRKIMEASAQSNLKPVSLELGGKSPNVIFADAPLEKVLEEVAWCSFYNTGQECTLGSRLYVQRGLYQQVVDHLTASAQKLSIGNGLQNPDLGPMVSEQQLNRVLNYIKIGQTEGANLVIGGDRINGDLAKGYFLEPTIFTHENDQLQIVQEEIFGPVVAVSPFDTFDEIVHRANDTKYGLAAAVWTKDISKAHKFAHATQAGTIWINSYDLFDAAVPFGGFKESGIGKEMGKSAIDLYTKEKAVWVAL